MKTITDSLQINTENLDSELDLFGKKKDHDGFIVEKTAGLTVICPYSKKKIHSASFSVLPGSTTFVNNYPYCFADHMGSHFDPFD